MDNALPIPFLDDPDRPELSYQMGFSLSPKVKSQIDVFEPTLVHITVPDCTTLHIIQYACLLYTSPSPRDLSTSRMPSSA